MANLITRMVAAWARALPALPYYSSQPPSLSVRAFSGAAGNSIEAPKAALLIIGNEVLSGSIADANTPWLAKLLHTRGVDLVRVEVVPDDKEDIATTTLNLRNRVGPNGFVFTSGGIGPTHDDVTYEAIASALGLALVQHPPTVALMQEHYAARGIELVCYL